MSVNNKAILLRSVSTLATAAASTALGVHGAQAQVVPAGTDGYYYSVTGGFALSKSERFLTGLNDKIGYSGTNGSGSSYSSSNSSYSFSSWASFGSSYESGLDDFRGLFASVSFGKQITENLDIRGSLSMSGVKSSGYGYGVHQFSGFQAYAQDDETGSGYSSGFHAIRSISFAGAEGTYTSSLLAADFEVGYTPKLSNNLNVRLFAGLRALKFTQTFEGVGSSFYAFQSAYSNDEYNSSGSSVSNTGSGSASGYSYYDFEGKLDATFTGIGPRVGVQASTRFEGSNFGLSGSLATSVLFGKQTVKFSGYSESGGHLDSSGVTTSGSSYNFSGSTSYSAGTSGYSHSGNKTVLDLQASIGVDYYLNDKTTLTVGYQGEKLLELGGDDLGSFADIDEMTHGAFVKLSGSL